VLWHSKRNDINNTNSSFIIGHLSLSPASFASSNGKCGRRLDAAVLMTLRIKEVIPDYKSFWI
jgi:hypothetical protein